MKVFDYSILIDRTWDNEIVSYLTQIHEYKGKQELYIRQKPVELERLIEIARIQSTEASNRIEGIVTTNARLKQLVENKTTPINRDEKEILGYRNALNIVHESYEHIAITPNYILQLHGEMLKHTAFSYAGKFKTTANEIAKTLPDGTKDEVHITEVILIAKDIAKDSVLSTFALRDKTHSNTRYWFDRYTSVHKSESTCANSSH